MLQLAEYGLSMAWLHSRLRDHHAGSVGAGASSARDWPGGAHIGAKAEFGSSSAGVIQGGLAERTQVSKDGFDVEQNMNSKSDSC